MFLVVENSETYRLQRGVRNVRQENKPASSSPVLRGIVRIIRTRSIPVMVFVVVLNTSYHVGGGCRSIRTLRKTGCDDVMLSDSAKTIGVTVRRRYILYEDFCMSIIWNSLP